MTEPIILHLTLTRKWFDLIATGVKTEEYREIKRYWARRLFKRKFDVIRFRNGYSSESPSFDIELKEIRQGIGRKDWGATGVETYILMLGEVLTA